MNFTASCLDQLDCPSVCDALGGLAVDLHYLISDLRGRYTLLLFALGRANLAQLPTGSAVAAAADSVIRSSWKEIKALCARLP